MMLWTAPPPVHRPKAHRRKPPDFVKGSRTGQAGDRPHDMAWLHGLHMSVEFWATAAVIKSS